MFTSALTSRWRRTGRAQPADQRHGGRGGIAWAVCAVAAAGAALATAGLAGTAAPAMAAARPAIPVLVNPGHVGYMATGRWFRFASTTLTVPPRIVPKDNSGDAIIEIDDSCRDQCRSSAAIGVSPGGGPGSVQYDGFTAGGSFRVSPQIGDRLTVSIYYDQQGHDYFTATDLTQQTTQTVELPAGVPDVAYEQAELYSAVIGDVAPPAADTRLWKFTGTRLTTYSGVHGTVHGPWRLTKLVKTTDGTFTGAMVASPSPLGNSGQNFGIWLRHQ